MKMKKDEFYGPADLLIGNTVTIFSRPCLIFDCNDATKKWYKDKYKRSANG